MKQSGHTGSGIVAYEPSSNSIFITSSSDNAAPHFTHLLFFVRSSRLRSPLSRKPLKREGL